MSRRTAFRPAALDMLEERVVLNAAPLQSLGALGDSLSDEYQFYSYSKHARNWVEQMAAAHLATFGGFSTASRGTPRNQGFATDWALSGATSADMVKNQLPGLAHQAAAGKVQYGVIFVGGNDLLHFLNAQGLAPSSPLVFQQQLQQVSQTIVHNITTAVDTLLAANPRMKVVVATIPNISQTPVTKQLMTTFPKLVPLFGAVDQAQLGINSAIRNLAITNTRVALADLNQFLQNLDKGNSITPFGGATISLNTASNSPTSFFLPDGLHTGTVGQGMMADNFIQAMDQKFGARIKLLAPTTIVNGAIKIAKQTRNLH